jgi:hypothetical protein
VQKIYQHVNFSARLDPTFRALCVHRIASHRIAQPPRACVACASTRFGSQYRFGVLNRLSPVRVGGYCIRYDSVPKLRRITIGFAEGLMRVCV